MSVVGPHDPLPRQWHASVLLAGPAPWAQAAAADLRERWPGPGRLVVFDAAGVDRAADAYRWLEARAVQADVIVFWLDGPAGAGHVLWGAWQDSGRVVLGLPGHGGDHGAYLARQAAERGIPVARSREEAVAAALKAIGAGAHRRGAHRQVPLPLWRTASFRHWLTAKESSGHRLEDARLAWSLPPSPLGGVFMWAVHPRIAIHGEQRSKANEVVLGRTDVVSVVAYRRGADLARTEITLVREFRSPAATRDGYVHELPGGSKPGEGSLPEAAASEFGEETGLALGVDRLRHHGARQPLGTLCAHRQHLFSVELTAGEVAALRATVAPQGVAEEGEQTTVEVRTFQEILADDLVDWTTLGLISGALGDNFGTGGHRSG